MARAGLAVRGLDTFKGELNDFPEKVQDRAIKSGVVKAAASIRTALRRAAYSAPPKTKRGFTRTLWQALRSSVGRAGGPKAGKGWVGLKKIKGEGKARNYYRTLEFGRNAYTKKTGAHYRATRKPLRPFFARAAEGAASNAAQILIDQTRIALAREAGRVAGRTRAGR